MHRWAWASSKGQPREGKVHPTAKGAIVFPSRFPPFKHKTEFLLCPLGSFSISFWKGTGNTFKEKKSASFLSGALPGKAGCWFLLLGGTSVQFPKRQVNRRKHREVEAGRHWFPEYADVHPFSSMPGGSVAQDHRLEAFAKRLWDATLCSAQRVRRRWCCSSKNPQVRCPSC